MPFLTRCSNISSDFLSQIHRHKASFPLHAEAQAIASAQGQTAASAFTSATAAVPDVQQCMTGQPAGGASLATAQAAALSKSKSNADGASTAAAQAVAKATSSDPAAAAQAAAQAQSSSTNAANSAAQAQSTAQANGNQVRQIPSLITA